MTCSTAMNWGRLKFSRDGATQSDVMNHLSSCNADFSPPLDSYVNISSYSEKIVLYATTFEAWDGAELVGLAAAYMNDPDRKLAFITNISVLKSGWGQGIASQLLRCVIGQARDDGFSLLRLQVNVENERATRLYEKYGFAMEEANDCGKATMLLNLR